MPDSKIELVEAIRALRRELIKAQQGQEDKEILFQVEDIDLEMKFEVSKSAGAEAGIKFWLVSLGGKGDLTSATTHTVRLKLRAITPQGGDIQVQDQTQTERPD
jgi:NTP-dependent ternary system trypsin peptidase co-occuring protein